MVKSTPAMQETWIRSLGQEDALVKEMATHPSILTWEIPWTLLQSQACWSCQALRAFTFALSPFYSFIYHYYYFFFSGNAVQLVGC